MYNLKYKGVYSGDMDSEIIELCNTMNSLPGIRTIESCSGHGKRPINIWFRVNIKESGLFFLTRCVDNRYWEYGHKWNIDLSVGDTYNGKLPTTYRLFSKDKGDEAYKQLDSLIDNMNYHLNHKNFMNGYELKIENFSTFKYPN